MLEIMMFPDGSNPHESPLFSFFFKFVFSLVVWLDDGLMKTE